MEIRYLKRYILFSVFLFLIIELLFQERIHDAPHGFQDQILTVLQKVREQRTDKAMFCLLRINTLCYNQMLILVAYVRGSDQLVKPK